MKPARITCTADFAEALKAMREELGMTHPDVDHAVGWQDGYCSKVEGFDRKWGKRPFNMTYNADEVLQALGLALVIVPIDKARELSNDGTVRDIKQIARQGKIARKETIVSCRTRYRSI